MKIIEMLRENKSLCIRTPSTSHNLGISGSSGVPAVPTMSVSVWLSECNDFDVYEMDIYDYYPQLSCLFSLFKSVNCSFIY